MKRRERTPIQLSMGQERWEKTLQGRPVVRCAMVLPRIEGGGRGGRAMERHYRRLEELWRRYIDRQLYLYACLELADRTARERPFRVWQAELVCRICWQQSGLISLRTQWTERRGWDRAGTAVWGDTWDTRQGTEYPLGAFAPHRRLGGRWLARRAGAKRPNGQFCLGEDGIHLWDRQGEEHVVRME